MDGSKRGGWVRKLSFRPDGMGLSAPAPALAGARRFQHGGFREVREVREESNPNYEPKFFQKKKNKNCVCENLYRCMSQKLPELPELPGAMQTTDFGPARTGADGAP
jgi:hypothetical protein